MGFRFRKSIKIAPGVKLNFNKKSTGVTFGGKGFHYTVNSKGKHTTSVGIPGTGLYYSTSSGGNTSKKKDDTRKNFVNETDGVENMKSKSKKKGFLPAIIISVVILGIIGSCGTDSKEAVTTTALSMAAEELITEEITTAPSTVLSTVTSTAEAETTQKITTTQEETTEKETTTQKPTTTEKETTTEKKTTTTKKATTTKKPTTTQKATTKKVTTTQKPTTAKKVTTTKKKVVTTKRVNSGSTDVRYILNTNSKKFHYPSCYSAAKISAENYAEFDGTRDEIIAKGYSPCGNCDP